MKRTDVHQIEYTKGTSAKDRRFARNMIVSVKDFTKRHGLYDVGVAYSGGIDSRVLCDICHNVRCITDDFHYVPVYVNHGLRPEENEKEAQSTRDLHGEVLCGKLGTCVTNIEATARAIRYDQLRQFCEATNAQGILTAHTLSDDIETMIMAAASFKFANLNKDGANQRAVMGMKDACTLAGGKLKVYRPLLPFTRKDVERYAAIFKLEWLEDSSNKDMTFRRNTVRHGVVPILREFNHKL